MPAPFPEAFLFTPNAVSIGEGTTHIIYSSTFFKNTASSYGNPLLHNQPVQNPFPFYCFPGGAVYLATAFVSRTTNSDAWGSNSFVKNVALKAGGSVFWQANLQQV